MTNLKIAGTERSPEIDFNFDHHQLSIRGESYPEDVAAFYGPVHQALDRYLAGLGGKTCRFEFELLYFNSSSAKAIMKLMDRLDVAAAQGSSVVITWRYDEEDDTMLELGKEFGEDIEHAQFELEKLAAPR